MIAEAAEAARRLGTDANLRGTAFGPVSTEMHQVNVAVTLGDAGTAIDLARQINPAAITVTERKASLLIDAAQAFFQWGKYSLALHRAPRRRYALPGPADQQAPATDGAGPLPRNCHDVIDLRAAGLTTRHCPRSRDAKHR